MKVMVLVKASQDSEKGMLPSTELMTKMGRFNQELMNAGILLSAEGLRPTSQGARINFFGETRSVRKGPFANSGDLVSGFWLWQVDSLEQAIDWVKRAPFEEEVEVEIRPVMEAADFGNQLPDELRKQESHMREASEGRKAS